MIEYVRTERLKTGDICVKDLYAEDGYVFWEKGRPLSDAAINRIKDMGYKGIYVSHKDEIRRELIPLEEPLFEDKLLLALYNTVKSLFNNRNVIYDPFDPQFMEDKKVIHEVVEEMVDTLILADKQKKLLFEVEDQRSYNTWIYFHSINVCLLSIGIAIKLGLPRKEIVEIALGAIYHDVGKARVDAKIVNKRDITEAEREILRNHPENMFRFLKKHGYPMNTLYAVWQHHEKMDGTGYPYGLVEDKIFKSAHIVACANAYDHLVNKNPYGGVALYAAEAIEYMSVNQEQDIECLKALFHIIAPYSVGTKVRLSNGAEALVVKNSTKQPLRPIILLEKKLVYLDSDSDYLNVIITGIIKDKKR